MKAIIRYFNLESGVGELYLSDNLTVLMFDYRTLTGNKIPYCGDEARVSLTDTDSGVKIVKVEIVR